MPLRGRSFNLSASQAEFHRRINDQHCFLRAFVCNFCQFVSAYGVESADKKRKEPVAGLRAYNRVGM